MRSMIKRIIAERKIASAKKLRRQLKWKGIQPAGIEVEHIMHVYDRLRKVRNPPDFSNSSEFMVQGETGAELVSSPVIGVIVETRKHPALELVVKSFMSSLKSPIQIFHSPANLEFIMDSSLAEYVEQDQIILSQLNADELNAKQYNALLLSREFWNRIRGRV